MKLRDINTGEEYLIQKAIFNNGSIIRGTLECPQMFEKPANDIFLIEPFAIKIKITLIEPKQPEFQVI